MTADAAVLGSVTEHTTRERPKNEAADVAGGRLWFSDGVHHAVRRHGESVRGGQHLPRAI